MYCDIHRLFLQMVAEHNEVARVADERLEIFISRAENRKRSVTPDLGDLIQYPLTLSVFIYLFKIIIIIR